MNARRSRYRCGRWLAPVGMAALLGACRAAAPVENEETAPAAAPSSSGESTAALPVDHLAPGELLAGGEQAFGVALPRGIVVAGSFAAVVYATGAFAVHPLVQYFRARLEGGVLREGPVAATFEHVGVRGKPGLELVVRIGLVPGGSSIEVRDATPPTAPILPDEAARWRQVGLTPNGRLADPSHLD